MTKGQRFVKKAEELIPMHVSTLDIDTCIDSYEALDELLFRRSEYLGGMAIVIIALLKQEDE